MHRYGARQGGLRPPLEVGVDEVLEEHPGAFRDGPRFFDQRLPFRPVHVAQAVFLVVLAIPSGSVVEMMERVDSEEIDPERRELPDELRELLVVVRLRHEVDHDVRMLRLTALLLLVDQAQDVHDLLVTGAAKVVHRLFGRAVDRERQVVVARRHEPDDVRRPDHGAVGHPRDAAVVVLQNRDERGQLRIEEHLPVSKGVDLGRGLEEVFHPSQQRPGDVLPVFRELWVPGEPALGAAQIAARGDLEEELDRLVRDFESPRGRAGFVAAPVGAFAFQGIGRDGRGVEGNFHGLQPYSTPTFDATAETPSRGVCFFHSTPNFFSK